MTAISRATTGVPRTSETLRTLFSLSVHGQLRDRVDEHERDRQGDRHDGRAEADPTAPGLERCLGLLEVVVASPPASRDGDDVRPGGPRGRAAAARRTPRR